MQAVSAPGIPEAGKGSVSSIETDALGAIEARSARDWGGGTVFAAFFTGENRQVSPFRRGVVTLTTVIALVVCPHAVPALEVEAPGGTRQGTGADYQGSLTNPREGDTGVTSEVLLFVAGAHQSQGALPASVPEGSAGSAAASQDTSLPRDKPEPPKDAISGYLLYDVGDFSDDPGAGSGRRTTTVTTLETNPGAQDLPLKSGGVPGLGTLLLLGSGWIVTLGVAQRLRSRHRRKRRRRSDAVLAAPRLTARRSRASSLLRRVGSPAPSGGNVNVTP